MNHSPWIAYIAATLSVALAIAAFLRKPRTLPVCAFAAGMALLSLESLFAGLTATALMPETMIYWQNWKLFIKSCLPGTWLLFSLTYARGNAPEFIAKWRLPLLASFIVPISVAAFYHSRLIVPAGATKPGYDWGLGLAAPGLALYFFFLIASVVILMNLERTYQASVGTMRWRIKFMILGLGVLFAARAYTSSQALLFHAAILSLQAVDAAGLIIASLLIIRSLFRAGYFEVHVYPSQSVIHHSITVMLAGLYLFIVGAFAKVATLLGGDASFTIKAFVVLLAIVLLTVVLMSERVRLHSRRFVSRHFQRPLYDYRSVWRSFTEATTSRVEQTELCRAVIKLVSDTFQVLSATIWLVEPEREKLGFGASTSLPDNEKATPQLSPTDAAEVIRALRNQHEPVDIDSSTESWSAALRRCAPDQFQKGGNRLCVPLTAGGELLGILTLGDRVSGVRFSVQDIDLLKCIGDQTAASLRNIQLSQRVMQAREMEAFQTMSAFFVHDLKNTASTLSLMLRNLPVHFHDPEFREDALRGIGKTVSHINDLISRLSLLRQELAIKPIETDLNQLVTTTLNTLNTEPNVHLVADLQPLPKLLIDPEQMQKVLTNLLLNARDAVGHRGEIRVGTIHENSWAILYVTDSGCGMTRDFLDYSLFRPFQTTKKTGIGIGMFQSKTIVEAHRGKIEVESGLGTGTTFRVFLPNVTQNQ